MTISATSMRHVSVEPDATETIRIASPTVQGPPSPIDGEAAVRGIDAAPLAVRVIPVGRLRGVAAGYVRCCGHYVVCVLDGGTEGRIHRHGRARPQQCVVVCGGSSGWSGSVRL